MKKVFTAFLLLFPIYFFGQTAVKQTLETNNIRAHVISAGLLFNNFGSGQGGFEAPKQPISATPLTTIYSSSLWLGGIDAGNAIYVAAQTYRQRGNDYETGPIDATEPPSAFDKLWQITKADIDSLTLTGIPNDNVSSWPAMYTTANGTEKLAPFFDYDGDGNYSPLAGDYPLFPGDEALFFTYNDDVLHTESLGTPLLFDIKGFVYQYKSATNEFLNNTVFVDYYLTNTSNIEYTQLSVGAWTDFDLGDYADDRIGTDINRNMYYAYNASSSDAVYGKNPPAMGVTFLNQTLSSSISFVNDFSNTGNPTLPQHFYRYLNGLWKDGSTMSDKGNGYNSGGTDTKFAFSGNPCSQTGWTEASGGVSAGDRRMVGAVSFNNFKPGETKKVTIAYTWARSDLGGTIPSLCKLFNQTDSLQQWYNKQPSLSVKHNISDHIKIYPNPATNKVFIETSGLQGKLAIEVYDVSGKVVQKSTEKIIDISKLSNGFYIIKGQIGDSHFIKKLQVD